MTPFCTTPLVQAELVARSSRASKAGTAEVRPTRHAHDAAVGKHPTQADPDKWDDSELINAVRRGLENLDAGAAAEDEDEMAAADARRARCSRQPVPATTSWPGRLAGQGPDRRRVRRVGNLRPAAAAAAAAPPPLAGRCPAGGPPTRRASTTSWRAGTTRATGCATTASREVAESKARTRAPPSRGPATRSARRSRRATSGA